LKWSSLSGRGNHIAGSNDIFSNALRRSSSGGTFGFCSLGLLWVRLLGVLEVHPAFFLILEFQLRWCRAGDLKGGTCWLAGCVS
jgi:hypothetical protein